MYIARLIHPGFASFVAMLLSQATQGFAPRPVVLPAIEIYPATLGILGSSQKTENKAR